IEQVGALVAVAGEMELGDAVGRHSRDVFGGGEPVVAGADVDVVDVEENAAIRAAGHLAEELPLADRRLAEGDIRGDVLEQHLPPERLLHLPDALDDMGEGLFGERKRPEVVDIAAAMAAPAEMV